MRIVISNKDFGDFTSHPITVQRIDSQEGVIYCNHDGADYEDNVVHHAYNDGSDSEYVERILACDKCEAFKREHDNQWEDAPFEGEA